MGDAFGLMGSLVPGVGGALGNSLGSALGGSFSGQGWDTERRRAAVEQQMMAQQGDTTITVTPLQMAEAIRGAHASFYEPDIPTAMEDWDDAFLAQTGKRVEDCLSTLEGEG